MKESNIYKINNVIDERTYELVISLEDYNKRVFLGDFLIVEFPVKNNPKKFVLQIISEKILSFSDYEKLITLNSVNHESLEPFELNEIMKILCLARLIGYIENNRLNTDIRQCILPVHSKVRTPTKEEYEILTNPNNIKKEEINKIGYFALGNKVFKEYPIYFNPYSFKEKRSAVFAKTGFGKSNLVKLLLLKILEYNMVNEDKFGIFVFDIDGEYAKSNEQNPGFLEINNDLIYVSNKIDKSVKCKLKINFSQLHPREVAEILKVAFKREDLVGLNILSSKVDEDTWKSFWVDFSLVDDISKIVDRIKEHFLNSEEYNISEASVNALIWRLDTALRKLHDFDGLTKTTIKQYVKDRKFVIFDLSSIEEKWGKVITEFICRNTFEYSQELFLNNNKTNLLLIFEEAQNYLDDNESIYTRITKEGRKFGLGVILITQQPAAIPNEIISQVDNFFVLHLLNNKDISALINANPHYELVAKFLQHETIKGLAYVYYGVTQPYVLPVKILNFNEEVEQYKKRKQSSTESPADYFH